MTVTEFRSLLALAEKGVTRRSTQPVQSNVLVERDSAGRLRLSATDLEFVEASAWEEGFDERDVRFRITLPPKALKGAATGKPAKAEVEFRPVTKREADLAIAGAVTRIIGLPAEDHELMPAPEKVHWAELTGKDLATLEQVSKACTEDLTRPTLAGVAFQFGAGMNRPEVVATDTCRLTKATLEADAEGHADPGEYIIPQTALRVLFGAARREAQPVRVDLSGKVAEFRGTRWRIRTRPIEGQFPDYRRVIPDPSKHSAGFVTDAEGLASAVSSVLPVAKEDSNRIAFVRTEAGVCILAAADTGQAHCFVAGEVNGNGASWPLGLNAKYLSEALPANGEVRIRWGDVLEPVVLEAPAAPLTVVMPMKLEGFPLDGFDAEPAPEPQPAIGDGGFRPIEPAEVSEDLTEEVAETLAAPEPAEPAEPERKPGLTAEEREELLQRAEADARRWGKPVRVTLGLETVIVSPDGQRVRVAPVVGGPDTKPAPESRLGGSEPEPAPCEVCEGKGELYTVGGQTRPCPMCRSTVSASPEPAEVPAAPAEVQPEPLQVRSAEPPPPPAPVVPHLSFADKETRKEDVKRALAGFCDTIAAGASDATFDQFLSYAARFHRYSWRNCLLIAWQRPDAYFVAGYNRWKDLGRKVKRGSKAIWILAPSRYHKTVETGDGDTEEVEALFFRPVPVFADVDTEGDGPLPNFRPDLAETADLLPALHMVAASWGVPVIRQACPGNGWSDGQRVNVHPALAEGVAAQTLIHELAHHLLKHRDLAEKHGTDRALFEGEAEAVKVVVLRHFGVDTSSNGAAYLRAHGAGADVVKRSASRIVQTAKQVIEALEEALAEPEAQPVAAG